MDLLKINVSAHDGAWFAIKTPDGTATVAEFLIVGKDSDECKEAAKIAANNIRKAKGEVNFEQTEEDNKRAVIACIKDWRDPATATKDKNGKVDPESAKHELTLGEEKLPCSPVTKRRIIDMFPFIYRQVDNIIVDDANFFKVSG